MRRKELEIKEKAELEEILNKADLLRVAFCDGEVPYIVPVNFGYKEHRIYFHSAKKGRKIDLIKRNNKVCFEVDVDYKLMTTDTPCDWGIEYRSVIGTGKAHIVEDEDERRKGLQILLEHYSGKTFDIPEDNMKRTAVIRIDIEDMTGKRSG